MLATKLRWILLLLKCYLISSGCFTGAQRWKHLIARVSHLYVSCRSVCDRDQNWIKQSKPFLRVNQGIKVTSKLQKSKDQECAAPIRPLICKKIKWSRAFEGMIKQSSTLFADQKSWSQSQMLQQYKWQPLDMMSSDESLIAVFHDLSPSSSAGVWHPLSPQTQWDCWKIPDNGMLISNLSVVASVTCSHWPPYYGHYCPALYQL